MSNKFDAEVLLDSILDIMTTGLNTKIAAVEAEKTAMGKSIGLAAVDSNAYYRQTWNDKILQYTPAIFYGIENTAATAVAGVTATQYFLFVEVIISDSGNDDQVVNRILRYTRALQELFEEQFGKVAEAGRIKIETVRPVSFKLDEDTSDEVKVGGISITLTLV